MIRFRSRAVHALLTSLLVLGTIGVAPADARRWARGPEPSDTPIEVTPTGPGVVPYPEGPPVRAPRGDLVPTTTTRTNIVVLVIDDIAVMDLRVFRRLPTIRTLFIEQGLRFNRAYGNDPLCCPGRASILTGLTTDHHGVWTNDARLFHDKVSLATELKAHGYFTILAGKYLNGNTAATRPPGWSRKAYTNNAWYDYAEFVNGVTVAHDGGFDDYQPDVTFNRALQFLREAPARTPIFAFLNPFTVHEGVDPHDPAKPRILPVVAQRFKGDRRCDDITPWRTPAHADDLSDRAPIQQGRVSRFPLGYPLEVVCESLLATDEGLGRVVRELKAQGRYRNTLFVMIADNGMGYGAHGWDRKSVSFATQIPLFVAWPAGRGTQPASSNEYVSNIDLAPTLCEVAGCQMGPFPDVGREGPDGTSMLGVIKGTGTLEREAIYTEHLTGPAWRGLLTTPASPLGRWSYVEWEDGFVELYDVSGPNCWKWQIGDPGDPCELTNLAGDAAHAETQAALHDLLLLAIDSGGADVTFRGRKAH